MRIFDAHCDVLWKMWENPNISFKDDKQLQVTWEGLKMTSAKVQCFAIYVPEKVKKEAAYDVALEMVDIFYERILARFPSLKLVSSKQDIQKLRDWEIGAILTLEGCDAIGSDISKLRNLYRLGVTSVGLTWNYGNAVADGILEERGAGLSSFGKKVVLENNHHLVWTDVSHLSVKGFWDVMEIGDYIIASHSNCKSLCSNARNLSDEQIKALIQKDAAIGVTFFPPFLTEGKSCNIGDVLRHVEHLCSLGAVSNIGFGSDFDGIDQYVEKLQYYQDFQNLINLLQKHYSESEVNGFLFDNFYTRYPR
ncbi:Membrane dipeptidase (Peptidase family M19) [Bacillus sp. THAF10]|uniref:dipeptidase n=1 Tax=Bacillus sp. THAF10 TaxID=2587848 RepID=UPI001267E216|nr:dipeptidase [Bacillus sp. THAF10]QFT88941.1 Membrane dipeptidase (Peptidase family M19) [Bacillus sp. THAF10]